jgi:hypothetical protein
LAIARGGLRLHESGTYVKFTQAGADLFAKTPTGYVFSKNHSFHVSKDVITHRQLQEVLSLRSVRQASSIFKKYFR